MNRIVLVFGRTGTRGFLLPVLLVTAVGWSASALAQGGEPTRKGIDASQVTDFPPDPPLLIIETPNWSDPGNHPETAARDDQEGTVIAETPIGKDGIPKSCIVIESSGHDALDKGPVA